MEKTFIIFPAIDLRQGNVVRLKEGDPLRQTFYSSSPAETALRWCSAGAQWLHVVNLDGAFGEESLPNRRALAQIAETAQAQGVKIQFGGGLRSLESIAAALESGIARAILGTAAVEQPEILEIALARWGAERIGVSLDAREGKIQLAGWSKDSHLDALQTACLFAEMGLRWLVYTDIRRDGLQTGINLAETVQVAHGSGLQVIASGGVRDSQDVDNARQAGLNGIIIGRALYEGTIDLAACLAKEDKNDC